MKYRTFEGKCLREYIYKAYTEYGLDKICEVCSTEEDICVHHIDENQNNNSRDNLKIFCRACHSSHHKSFTGKRHSDETKQKIREWNTGKFVSEETRAKISKARRNAINCIRCA
jgi:5-methylcytosine-specific restriction endonuclease McrA